MNLYDIEAGLSEALTVWQEAMETDALEAHTGEQTQAERIAAADLALRTYAELELRKVDDYIATMRSLKAALEYRKAEAERHKKAAQGIQNALDWLKQYAQTAMEAWGKKRLEGKTGYLLLKGNGGKQPVTVYDESLVPDEYCTVTVTFRADQWMLGADWEELVSSRDIKVGPRVPSLSLIAAALDKPCSCVRMMGASKAGWYSELEEIGPGGARCPSCGGSGKPGVPGARLEPRSSHVEVK